MKAILSFGIPAFISIVLLLAANVFLVKKGTLYTPQTGILRGITRATVIHCAARAGIPCCEAPVTSFDLYTADEVFTCSTAGGALPVREIAGRPIPGPVPGPVCQKIDEVYWQMRNSGEFCDEI